MTQPDLFGGVCQGKGVTPCLAMDGGMVCLCGLVANHGGLDGGGLGGQCRCSNCKELFTPQGKGEAYARGSDPSTSKAAAATVEGETANHLERMCVNALVAQGPMTTTEVAVLLGVDKWSISPRFAPLKRKGLIMDTGKQRGRSIIWAAT